MPCLPGFLPVMKEVQAGGVIGGRIDASLPQLPLLIRLASVGSLPSAIHGPISSRVAASSPTMRSRGVSMPLCSRLIATFWLRSSQLQLTAPQPAASPGWDSQLRPVTSGQPVRKLLRPSWQCSANRSALIRSSSRWHAFFAQDLADRAQLKYPRRNSPLSQVRLGTLSLRAEVWSLIAEN